MTTVLNLLYGNDILSPTRTQSMAGDLGNGGKIDINNEGLVIGSGEMSTIYTSPTLRREGSNRIASIPANQTIQLTYSIAGETAPDIGYLQRLITRFEMECKLRHEESIGEKIWLQYRIDDQLSTLSEPTFGILSHFLEILEIRTPKWSDSHHSQMIKRYRVGGIVAELVTRPYAQAPEQLAGDADGIITSGSDVIHTWDTIDISTLMFHNQFSLSLWIDHRESDYVIFEFYSSGTSNFRIEWDQSDSRFELLTDISGETRTNGSSQSLTAGDPVHICIRQNTNNLIIDINGEIADISVGDNAWGQGHFYIGNDIAGSFTGNNTGDGLKIWLEDIGATVSAQIYTNELPIKTAGGMVCPILFARTIDGGTGASGSNTVNAVDGLVSSSDKDNCPVIGGIPGDVEAEVRFEFDPPTGGTLMRGYWMSRRATQSVFTPKGTSHLVFTGTAASGLASDDAYESSGSVENHTFDATISTIRAVRGHPIYLARIRGTESAANIYPYYKLGAQKRLGSKYRLQTNNQFRLIDVGRPPKIDWPDEVEDTSLEAGLFIEADSSSTLLDNLLFCPDFEESSGVRFDKFGGHHCLEYSTVSHATGPSGSNDAVEFSGSDLLWTPGNNNLSQSGDISGSLFIYVDDLADANSAIIAKHGGAAGGMEWVLYFLTSGNTISFQVSDDGQSITSTVATAAVSATTWYHIYYYHDDGTEIGIRINDTTTTTTAHTTGLFAGIEELTIGGRQGGGGGDAFFDGRVAYPRFYNRLLTSAEITAHYNSGDGLPYPFTTTTIDLDFINIISRPYISFEAPQSTLATGDTIVQKGTEAWIEDASGSDATLHYFNHVAGDPITLVPNHFNYVTMMLGANNDVYDVTRYVTNFKVFVTPRFRLPGA